MESRRIKVIISGQKSEAFVKYDSERLIMTFSEADNFKKKYHDKDLFTCLAKIRIDFPNICFLCKGAKINVFPSRMTSQMSSGLIAYEMTLHKQATRENIVNIFDYEEKNLTTNPKEQVDFFKSWLKSLGAEDYEKHN